MICDKYLENKILPTPELQLFIQKNFKTEEQVNFRKALYPAYLSVFVTIIVSFHQVNDKTEMIIMESYLNEMKEIKTNLEVLKDELSIINEYLSSEDEWKDKIVELINLEIEKLGLE